MQRKVSDTVPTKKIILGTVATSFAALGIVVVAATLSPPQHTTCTAAPTHAVAPAMEPVDNIPSFTEPPPRPIIRDPRPMPPPSK